jgi:Domain of unknown function (DUF4349)
MIDEDWLRQTLEEIGSAITVPADGPEGVLAARERLPRAQAQRRAPGVRIWARRPAARSVVTAIAVTVVLAGIAVVVVSGGRGRTGHVALRPAPSRGVGSTAASSRGEFGPSAGTAGSSGGAAAAATADAGSSAGNNAGGVTSPIPAVPALASRIVKTGDIGLVVAKGKLGASVDQLGSLAVGLGGYVADTKANEGGSTPTADITLQVPVDRFEAALRGTRALGRPISVATSSKDVTADYVDLDARIHSLQATRDQFLQILAKATTIGDTLAVQQQLTGIQTQIEQLQGQQRVLDSQTSYSTLAVHVSEPDSSPGVPKPPSGWSKAWVHARHSFTHGLEAVIGWLGGFGVFAICVIALLLAGRVSWSAIRRRLV